jgi:hypothetical protein
LAVPVAAVAALAVPVSRAGVLATVVTLAGRDDAVAATVGWSAVELAELTSSRTSRAYCAFKWL